MLLKDAIIWIAAGLGVAPVLVVLADAMPRARAALRRRRLSGGGAFGAVVDPAGAVLGVYLDPWGHPWRAARVHHQGPWLADERWVCEGFGATAEEAVDAANRLRRRHRQHLELVAGVTDDPDRPEILPG